jgi:hypothetical protein
LLIVVQRDMRRARWLEHDPEKWLAGFSEKIMLLSNGRSEIVFL